MERQLKAVSIAVGPGRLQPLRERVRVAVIAARADVRAAREEVPGRISPLNRAVLSHADAGSVGPGSAFLTCGLDQRSRWRSDARPDLEPGFQRPRSCSFRRPP